MKKKTKIVPEEDGITHINVYSKGATELGRLLSNFAHTPVLTEDGPFESLEGYWYWLGSTKDKDAELLRELHGWKAKQYGREIGAKDWLEESEFRLKIEKAMKAKIEQHPRIAEMLGYSTLPFTHYYVYGGKVVNVKESKWILEIWELLRQELNICL